MDREPNRNRRRKAAKQAAQQNQTDTTRVGRIVKYLRGFGAFSVAAAGVTLMLLPEAFPYFVSFVVVAGVLWTADAVFELREYPPVLRAVPVVVGLIAIGLFGKQFIFASVPLSEYAWSTGGAYQPGETVGGIQWSTKFNDIHVTIGNTSDYDYNQVDLLIKPPEPVLAATIVTPSSNASISRELFPMAFFDLELWHHKTGVRTDITIEWFASTGGFRLRCDSLPRQSNIEVLMAIATPNQKTITAKANTDYVSGPWGVGKSKFWLKWQNFPLNDNFFDPRPDPKTVEITGQYTAFYRHKHMKESLSVSQPITNAVIQKALHK